jgi:magnesium chelatase family protein
MGNFPQQPCVCNHVGVTKYQKRISGPLLDRKVPHVLGGKVPHVLGGIDIHIEVPRVDYEKLSSDRLGESSALIRERVQAARERQRVRFEGSDIVCPVQEPGLLQFGYARGGSTSVLQAG